MNTEPASRRNHWKQDPEAVRADILRIATEEFAAHGLAGARIDEIARRTAASKRMIYYYFGDKEGLYTAVLEAAYARIRDEEGKLQLDDLDPVSALRRLLEFSIDSHRRMADFVRLVMIENIHHAEYLKKSKVIAELNAPVIEKMTEICDRGKACQLFRDDASPVELHWMISAMSFYNQSNRETFSCSISAELFSEERQAELRERIVRMILRSILKNPQAVLGD